MPCLKKRQGYVRVYAQSEVIGIPLTTATHWDQERERKRSYRVSEATAVLKLNMLLSSQVGANTVAKYLSY